ncbi:hypothetical protein ABTM80_18880, partial [Acinetobacter baumannii]
MKSYPVHSGQVTALIWHSSDRLIASADSTSIKIWETETGRVLSLQGQTSYVYSLSWYDQEDRIAAASADRTIKIWNTITGELLNSLEG